MDLFKSTNDIIKITRFNNESDFFNIDSSIFDNIISTYEKHPITIDKIYELDTIHKEYSNTRSVRFVIDVVYTKNNVECKKSFFIKKPREKQPHEAIHYLYLQNYDAPIPKLYAYYSEENESDIIITEVVNPLHDDYNIMHREEIFNPFIIATAEFNSIKIDDNYRNFLSQRYDIVNRKVLTYKRKLEDVYTKVHDQEIYIKFQKDLTPKTLDKLLALHEKICRRIIPMEKGLYHWDHIPRNTGWSDLQKRHVLFDLEATLWAPRFYNIGMWIGGGDEFQNKYTSREVLAEIYLSIYNQRLGTNISVDSFIYECYPLWLICQFELLLNSFNDCDDKILYYIDLLVNTNLR